MGILRLLQRRDTPPPYCAVPPGWPPVFLLRDGRTNVVNISRTGLASSCLAGHGQQIDAGDQRGLSPPSPRAEKISRGRRRQRAQ